MHGHILYTLSYVLMCFCISMCVSGAWVITHSDCEQRPLAGKTVGLAGLRRALKQLCSAAQLHWWLQAHLSVTLKRHSRELLIGRPQAKKQHPIMSYCWQKCWLHNRFWGIVLKRSCTSWKLVSFIVAAGQPWRTGSSAALVESNTTHLRPFTLPIEVGVIAFTTPALLS